MFVNAIELFLFPNHLTDEEVMHFTYSGNNWGSSPYNGLHSQVLETKLRLNVDSQIFNDALSRKWIPNDTYLENP